MSLIIKTAEDEISRAQWLRLRCAEYSHIFIAGQDLSLCGIANKESGYHMEKLNPESVKCKICQQELRRTQVEPTTAEIMR